MPDPPILRLAEAADAGTVAALVVVLATDLGEDCGVTAGYVAEALTKGSVQVLLAERSGEVLGMASFSFHPSLYHSAASCRIDELIVAPAARNEGLGTLLLEQVVKWARADGCAEVSLSVMSSNLAARRFYERQGFTGEAITMERHFPAG